MPPTQIGYPIAPRGRAKSFTESEIPPDYCLEMRNRFINAAGGAEKRRGVEDLGNDVDGAPNLTGMHEFLKADGTSQLFTSGQGKIWRFDNPSFTQVHSGLDESAVIRSVQMEEKLIFYNNVDRNIFTEDGTEFKELQAIIERGEATSGTDSNSLQDSNVDNWVSDTNVAVNDIVRNLTKNATAVVTSIATACVGHTAIGTNPVSAIGAASAAQTSGDRYEIVDTVELNIIPTDGEDDNVATLGSGSGDNTIVVSAVTDWTKTEARIGDYVRNTTRSGIAQITVIATAELTTTGVSAMQTGDSVIFLKSAMPISKRVHVHFGRAYHVDSRDERFIRVSGPDNPEDMTTEAATIDSGTFKFGSTQPEGDAVLSMGSFQRFFALAGRKNFYFFEGTDPIQDTTAATTNFDIIGLFPQGSVSPDGLVSIGNDMVWVTPDGVQSVSLVGDASTLGRANLSEAIKVELREEINSNPEAQIKAFHYPRRSWYMLKIGSRIHVFNYTAYFGEDPLSARARGELSTQQGSWSVYDGRFARQNDYLVRADRTMVCCGPGGKVYKADVDNVFTDDGEEYSTTYQTGWLTLEPKERRGVTTKQGHYIKTVIDAGDTIVYTLLAEAGFELQSRDQISIPASGGATPIGLAVVGAAQIGGTTIQNIKRALRWRGEQVRLTFTTKDDKGPDTISRYTLYATLWGKK